MIDTSLTKIKSYSEALPQDHFNGLHQKTLDILSKGENVLISAIHGCGGTIFLNLFSSLMTTNHVFDHIHLYNPAIEEDNLLRYIKKAKSNQGRQLVIVKSFEKMSDKQEVLEKLHALRQPHSFNLVFLIFSDHTGVTNLNEHRATNSSFFNGRFFIGPFDMEQTKEMIAINSNYFGWDTDRKLDEQVYKLSGGMQRITKHICQEMAENGMDLSNHETFISNPSIYFQLDHLTKIVLQNNKNTLKKLGIVNETGNIKSILLQEYLKQYKSQFIKDIYMNLSSLEAKVLTFFYENKDRIISTEEIGDFLEINGHEFSLWAVYKLISRLKTKVKSNFEIQNVKGEGYLLRLRSADVTIF